MGKAGREHSPFGVRLIVAYKFGKAALELGAAVAVPLAAAHTLPDDVLRLSLVLHEHLSARWSHLYQAVLSAGTTSHLRVLALALAVDGLSSLVEGWAVWRRRPWAPWLIVVATGSLVPIEVTLIIERPTAMKIFILAVNVATVAYMVHLRMQARHAAAPPVARRRRLSVRRAVPMVAVGLLGAYLGLAYLALPWLVKQRKAARILTAAPDRTVDAVGQPSDPLNIGMVGTGEEISACMQKAGWTAAQPLSRRSGADIAADVLFHRPDPTAPVSSLYFEGRRQDLAFEQEVGGSPRRRHHVRLWLQPDSSVDGRPVWLGASTYDKGVGLARDTGEITHVIDRNIDAERDKLIADLVRCGCATSVHRVPGVGPIPERRRGRIYTDGMAAIAVLGDGGGQAHD